MLSHILLISCSPNHHHQVLHNYKLRMWLWLCTISPFVTVVAAGFTLSTGDNRDKEDMHDEIIRLKKVKSYKIIVVYSACSWINVMHSGRKKNPTQLEHVVHQGVSSSETGDFSPSGEFMMCSSLVCWNYVLKQSIECLPAPVCCSLADSDFYSSAEDIFFSTQIKSVFRFGTSGFP